MLSVIGPKQLENQMPHIDDGPIDIREQDQLLAGKFDASLVETNRQ
jgi:hypothetical protein